MKLPKNTAGCNCIGTCGDPKTCSCAKLNGGDFPYVHRDGGRWVAYLIDWLIWFLSIFLLGVPVLCVPRLIEAKDVVFECGPGCGCGPGCVNRTSQRGFKYRFEVVLILKLR